MSQDHKDQGGAVGGCPFCGHNSAPIAAHISEFWEDENAEADNFQVCCRLSMGGCGASSGVCRTIEKAIEVWNARSPAAVETSPNPLDLNQKLADAESKLRQWEEVCGPILDFAQKNGEALGIPLGGSISAHILALLQNQATLSLHTKGGK